MNTPTSIVILISLAAITASPPLAAQDASSGITIPIIDRPPELADFDGMRPSAEIAAKMSMASDFVQRIPDNGEPATQRTEVYVAYDDTNFYAVFLAFDNQPELVRANLSPRENVDNDDTVGILIDTFNDQRTGYAFRSTPLGVQWDGRWNEAGRGQGFDSSYQAVWYTEGELRDTGFIVKMTVPLKTLRFPKTGEQLWRIMFERDIPRLSEQAHWPAYSNSISGRLNQAASLAGIRDVEPGRNLQVVPFAFVRDFDVLDTGAIGGPAFRKNTEDEVGIDAKFVFNDSFVLDATFNPDFSQVESDEPQVTVNERFEVRFTELRPFFLENADFFATEAPLVFTRRIVDPELGVRLTGKQGDWGIGTMLMDDAAPGQGRSADDPLSGESANVGIFRVFREIFEQSRIGFLYTDRDFANSFNEVASLDAHFKLTDNWSTDLQYVESDSLRLNGKNLTGTQRNIRIDRRGRNLTTHIHFIDTTPGFRTDLGFLGRTYKPDTDGAHVNATYTFWPENSRLIRWAPRLTLYHLDDQTGTRIYTQIQPRISWAWEGDTEFRINYTTEKERLRPQDFPGIIANRDYESDTWALHLESQASSKIGFSSQIEVGAAINLVPALGMLPELADLRSSQLDLLWRPIDRLRIDTSYLSTELTDRGGTGKIFSNKILRSRWNYQFTKELSLRFIAQHEETDPGTLTSLEHEKGLNFDVLVRYVLNPWSALYVGYNSNSSNFNLIDTEDGTELIRTNDFRKDGEQLFVKFSYLIQP